MLRRDRRVSLLRAGVLAAGVGAALVAAPGVAGADDGGERTTASAGRDAPTATRPHASNTRSATEETGPPRRPVSARVANRAERPKQSAAAPRTIAAEERLAGGRAAETADLPEAAATLPPAIHGAVQSTSAAVAPPTPSAPAAKGFGRPWEPSTRSSP